MTEVLKCAYCGRTAEELEEYDIVRDVDEYTGEFTESRTAACWREEGTLNHRTGLFACSPCYIRIGMPTAPGGWTPPGP